MSTFEPALPQAIPVESPFYTMLDFFSGTLGIRLIWMF